MSCSLTTKLTLSLDDDMKMIEGEKNTQYTLYFKRANSYDVVGGLSAYTLGGVMEKLPGPGNTVKTIAGTLVLADEATGAVTYTTAEADTDTPGEWRVILTASQGSTVALRSLPFIATIEAYPTVP